MQIIIWIYVAGCVLMFINGIIRAARSGALYNVQDGGIPMIITFVVGHLFIALIWPIAVITSIFVMVRAMTQRD